MVRDVRCLRINGILGVCKSFAAVGDDTVVTPGWLNALAALVKKSDRYGMTGPMSYYAAPPQLIEAVPFRVGVSV